jgi:hypothetical protein
MSGIIDAQAFTDVLTELKDNATMQGTVTAFYEIGKRLLRIKFGPFPLDTKTTPGCLFGAIFMLTWGDWLGRRRGIIGGAVVMILGVIVQVTSYAGKQPLAQFTIGRIITSVGNGMNTSTIPTYQAGMYSLKWHKTLIAQSQTTNFESRVLSNLEPWTSHLYRGWYHCLWYTDCILDRFWCLIWPP